MWVDETLIIPFKKLTLCSGDASIDGAKGSMCLADPIYGVSVHRLEDGVLRKVNSFEIPVTKKTRVRKVSFANQCREVVGGSDHGLIYVFDRKEGHMIDKLRIDPGEWAQTVTVSLVFQVGP